MNARAEEIATETIDRFAVAAKTCAPFRFSPNTVATAVVAALRDEDLLRDPAGPATYVWMEYDPGGLPFDIGVAPTFLDAVDAIRTLGLTELGDEDPERVAEFSVETIDLNEDREAARTLHGFDLNGVLIEMHSELDGGRTLWSSWIVLRSAGSAGDIDALIAQLHDEHLVWPLIEGCWNGGKHAWRVQPYGRDGVISDSLAAALAAAVAALTESEAT